MWAIGHKTSNEMSVNRNTCIARPECVKVCPKGSIKRRQQFLAPPST